MRGTDQQQGHVFSYISPEQRVRQEHPLRPIRAMVDQVLQELSPKFDKMYSKAGRPSIPPEQLLRALLLQMLYTVRSERLLMEQLDYNILFRWFVGLNLDDAVWVPTVFTKNRDRLLEGEVAKEFLARVVQQARAQGWAGDEHFTVGGTLLEAWAGAKSFQPKDTQDKKEKPDAPPPEDSGNPTVDFHGERRSNATHESQSDPDALLARKGQGKEAKLSYCGNLLVENRHGLIVDSRVAQLGLLALAFARQQRVGIALRFVRCVAAPLAVKIHRGISGILRRRRIRLFFLILRILGLKTF